MLVRSDLHPEIVQLMLQTMVEVHGARAIFQRSGEFPNSTDTEYPSPLPPSIFTRMVLRSCKGTCRYGYPSMQRAIAVLVTAIAIGFPLLRILPLVYNWITRRRLFYWYAKLKALEASFDADPMERRLDEKQAEIGKLKMPSATSVSH